MVNVVCCECGDDGGCEFRLTPLEEGGGGREEEGEFVRHAVSEDERGEGEEERDGAVVHERDGPGVVGFGEVVTGGESVWEVRLVGGVGKGV